MSKKNKLQRFAELLSFPNVYQNFSYQNPVALSADGQELQLKGKWNELHFKNDHPITLELACGRGEYTVALASMYPERNFIGLDIKGARIWKGAGIALEEGLHNAAFLRTRIELIEQFFAPGEVSEIWITFPDPFHGKPNRRLTAPRFLDRYQRILPSGGLVHLKTDDPDLYAYTLEAAQEKPGVSILYQDDNIYTKPLPMPELEFKTYYERMHLAIQRTIKYVRLSILD